MEKKHEKKRYLTNECCVFKKTKERHGGLSNMASGFSLIVNEIPILTSEALYQACRFPHLPEVQRKIISEKSPMSAKMVGKPYRDKTRIDWDKSRVYIMRWCLRIKLAQNFLEFGELLKSTGEKEIVEESNKDDFWGAIRDRNNYDVLEGTNALGRLLMELRKYYFDCLMMNEPIEIPPPDIPGFLLYGEEIKSMVFNPFELLASAHNLKVNDKGSDNNFSQGKFDF